MRRLYLICRWSTRTTDRPLMLVGRYCQFTPPLMKFYGRRVKSNHPKIVHRFNLHFKRFVINNRLAHRIFQLEKEVTFPIQEHHRRAAEEIASLRADGIQYADKKCRRLFRGQIEFTPQLKERVASVRAWKLIRRKLEGRKVSSRLIVRMLKRASITRPCSELLRLSLDEVKMNLASSYKEYREYKQNAAAARKTWLLDLAESRANNESHHSATDKHL